MRRSCRPLQFKFPFRPPFRPLLLAVAFALLGAGCGGGGGGGGEVAPPAPPPPVSLLPPATGPGDVENYAPDGPMDTWYYNASTSDGAMTLQDMSTVSVTGSRSVLGATGVTVYSERMASDPVSAPAYELYYREMPGGVAYYGNNDPADTLTAGVVPYAELLFPVATGPIITFSKTGLDFGEDLDGDGRNETVDATQTISITGFEDVTVPAGTFPGAARRLNVINATARLTSTGQAIAVTTTETTWLARGAGIVKRETVAAAPGLPVNLNVAIEARGFAVGGVKKGMTLPQELMGAGMGGVFTQTNFGQPPDPFDTPAVASSGSTFLVLAKRYSFDQLTGVWLLRRIGFLRSPDGPLLTPMFDVGPPVPSNDTRELQSLAYGGGTYLAVFEQRNPIAPNIAGTTEPSIVVQRIAPDGTVTDPVPLDLWPQGIAPMIPGLTGRLPQVAYGGGRFLVVYHGGPAISSSTFIEGRFVEPGGTLGAPFRITPDFTFAGIVPRVVFDGANFIVASGDMTGWRLARVTPAGTVLDPAGVPITAPAGALQMTTSGAGGALITWLAGDVVYARRFAADLTALEGGPITAAGAGTARYAVNAGFVGGEYVLAWTQRQDAMNAQSLVVYLTRIGVDGTVHGQTAPSAPAGAPPYAALVSAIPPMPASGYTGGYALPAFGTGSNAALLAYVSGTANGMTVAERELKVHSVWVHPFAR